MINNVVLMGRLTATPELKQTGNGIAVTSFSIAIDRRYQAAGSERTSDFLDCVAWRQTAEFICKYFKKGEMIAVTGELQKRKYEVDGQNRYATEVIVNNASFCGGKNNNVTEAPADVPAGFTMADTDDDLPF